jgi:hypothetical protein
MKRYRNIIIKYIEGDLSLQEKFSFEEELKNSQELRNELLRYENFNSLLNETKNPNPDQTYFNSILPEFRKRLEGRKQKRSLSKIAYAFPAAAILFLIFFFLINNRNEEVFLNQNVNSRTLSDTRNYGLMDFSVEDLLPSTFTSNEKEKFNTELNSIIEKELNVSSDSAKYIVADQILDYNTILDNLSEKDAERVYNDILNKKF